MCVFSYEKAVVWMLSNYSKLNVGLIKICSIFAAMLDMVVKYSSEASVLLKIL